MTPPEATGAKAEAGALEMPPAVSVRLEVMKSRPQFLAAARGRRHVLPSMVVQARDRGDDSPTIHVGYTCSKKVGNSVARNRAKRRMREAARAVMPDHARPGWDYVLIGRKDTTAARPFPALMDDLARALDALHR